MPFRPLAVVMVLCLSLSPPIAVAYGDAVMRVLASSNAALLVDAANGERIIAHQADRPMIPASTIKLLTALAAIEHWGLDHHFATDFYQTEDRWLWVKGSGDPFLVSEELDRLALALKAAGMRKVAGIGIDAGHYAADLMIPGRSASWNPYDAPITAFGVNFNTVHIRSRGGRVISAEVQTPLTPLSRELGRRLGPGTLRVNVGDRAAALRYAGELLRAKLLTVGIETSEHLVFGALPSAAQRIMTYRNSHELRTVVAAMLEHSSNFIANQLFLSMAAGPANIPVDIGQAQRNLMDWGKQRFRWRDFHIEDGAGLSRGNRLSARQLLDVVAAFLPYRALLPVQPDNPNIRAKTGTLHGVSAYAGLIRQASDWAPFALVINESVEPALRRRVATELATDVELICARGPC